MNIQLKCTKACENKEFFMEAFHRTCNVHCLKLWNSYNSAYGCCPKMINNDNATPFNHHYSHVTNHEVQSIKASSRQCWMKELNQRELHAMIEDEMMEGRMLGAKHIIYPKIRQCVNARFHFKPILHWSILSNTWGAQLSTCELIYI